MCRLPCQGTPSVTTNHVMVVCCLACRSTLQHSCERLLNGVNKLNETEALVTSMKADLANLQPVLEAKAAATAELLVKVCYCQCLTLRQAAVCQPVSLCPFGQTGAWRCLRGTCM